MWSALASSQSCAVCKIWQWIGLNWWHLLDDLFSFAFNIKHIVHVIQVLFSSIPCLCTERRTCYFCGSSMALVQSHTTLMVSPCLPAALNTWFQFCQDCLKHRNSMKIRCLSYLFKFNVPSQAKRKPDEHLAKCHLHYFYAGLYLTFQTHLVFHRHVSQPSKMQIYDFENILPKLRAFNFVIELKGCIYLAQSNLKKKWSFFMCRPWKGEGWL